MLLNRFKKISNVNLEMSVSYLKSKHIQSAYIVNSDKNFSLIIMKFKIVVLNYIRKTIKQIDLQPLSYKVFLRFQNVAFCS